MKLIQVKITDKVSFLLEKMTNPQTAERQITDRVRKMQIVLTKSADDALSLYSNWSLSKSYLCGLLLSGFEKAWQGNKNELEAIRTTCIEVMPLLMLKTKSKVGKYKTTKALIASAIIDRIIKTQDVNNFFSKAL
jgi:hypothetical protein